MSSELPGRPSGPADVVQPVVFPKPARATPGAFFVGIAWPVHPRVQGTEVPRMLQVPLLRSSKAPRSGSKKIGPAGEGASWSERLGTRPEQLLLDAPKAKKMGRKSYLQLASGEELSFRLVWVSMGVAFKLGPAIYQHDLFACLILIRLNHSVQAFLGLDRSYGPVQNALDSRRLKASPAGSADRDSSSTFWGKLPRQGPRVVDHPPPPPPHPAIPPPPPNA